MVAKRARSPSARYGERLHGDQPREPGGAYAGVYEMVRRIPRGRVMTYGQIAALLEHRLSPRAVGWALHGSPDDVPWQRVVNASGGCSTNRLPDLPDGLQQALLRAEGVKFREDDTLDLERYRWAPGQSSGRSPATRR